MPFASAARHAAGANRGKPAPHEGMNDPEEANYDAGPVACTDVE
jgi:hypothetical protein